MLQRLSRAQAGAQEGGYDIATLFLPDAWRAQIAFTEPGHPAHPAVTLRTQRKQVDGGLDGRQQRVRLR